MNYLNYRGVWPLGLCSPLVWRTCWDSMWWMKWSRQDSDVWPGSEMILLHVFSVDHCNPCFTVSLLFFHQCLCKRANFSHFCIKQLFLCECVPNAADIKVGKDKDGDEEQAADQTMLDEDAESGHCDAAELEEKWHKLKYQLSQTNKQTAEQLSDLVKGKPRAGLIGRSLRPKMCWNAPV